MNFAFNQSHRLNERLTIFHSTSQSLHATSLIVFVILRESLENNDSRFNLIAVCNNRVNALKLFIVIFFIKNELSSCNKDIHMSVFDFGCRQLIFRI